MIGLHPTLTQFDLPDGTPAYSGVGAPRAVISAPAGGSNFISGFGVFTGGINPRAVAVLWSAGEGSLIDDVAFWAGMAAGRILITTTTLRTRICTKDGTDSIQVYGLRTAAVGRLPISGLRTPSRRRAFMSPTPGRPAMSTSFRTNTMSATRSGSITWRIGTSTLRRRRKRRARVLRRYRWSSIGARTLLLPTIMAIG